MNTEPSVAVVQYKDSSLLILYEVVDSVLVWLFKIKEETKATIRCIVDDVNDDTKKCIYSNKPAKHLVVFAKAY